MNQYGLDQVCSWSQPDDSVEHYKDLDTGFLRSVITFDSHYRISYYALAACNANEVVMLSHPFY